MIFNQLKAVGFICFISAAVFPFCQEANRQKELPPKFSVTLQVNPQDETDLVAASKAVLEALKKRLENQSIAYSRAEADTATGRLLFDIIGYAPESGRANTLEPFVRLLTEQPALEFWETYRLSDVGMKDSLLVCYQRDSLFNFLKISASFAAPAENSFENSVWGYADVKDLPGADGILNKPETKSLFPPDLRFCWSAYPMTDIPGFENKTTYELYALKAKENGQPFYSTKNVSQLILGKGESGDFSLSGALDEAGARALHDLTTKLFTNGNRELAIVFNDWVLAVPKVATPISKGRFIVLINLEEQASQMEYLLKNSQLPHPVAVISKKRLR